MKQRNLRLGKKDLLMCILGTLLGPDVVLSLEPFFRLMHDMI